MDFKAFRWGFAALCVAYLTIACWGGLKLVLFAVGALQSRGYNPLWLLAALLSILVLVEISVRIHRTMKGE